jgi:hypothetical protein
MAKVVRAGGIFGSSREVCRKVDESMTREKIAMTERDWRQISDRVVEILDAVYVQQRSHFEAAADKRRCSVESLTVAAITGMLREHVMGAVQERADAKLASQTGGSE